MLVSVRKVFGNFLRNDGLRQLEKGQIGGLTEIYYIDKNNLLRLLWKKKEAN